MKTIKIKELGIEVRKPIKWTKQYNEIEKPKGWRLPHVWELFQIHEMPEYKYFIFGEEGYLHFWCEQLSIDKKNDWSRVLYRNWYLDLVARNDDLAFSYSGGRVSFVRELEGDL